MPVIRVFACEAQPVAIEGLRKVLAETGDLELVGSAATPTEAMEKIKADPPDIVLVDQHSGLRLTLNFLNEIKTQFPATRAVLWIVEMAEIESFRALQLGARGILRRSLPISTMVDCLRTVGKGNLWLENTISDQVVGFLSRRNSTRLTPREREIVKLICRGMKNKEIAEQLMITPGTVKVHLMHIFEKTGVKDRFELAVQGGRLLGGDSTDPNSNQS
jgi:two-component system, NarL family, nitrate/nitrite response regulator NarL